MYQKIAVAIDGSETSAQALAEALKLAQLTGATVLLLHVCEELPLLWEQDGSGPTVMIKEVLDAMTSAAAHLLELRRKEVDAAGVKAETRLVTDFSGHVGAAISREAQDWGAELLVIGTHGRKGFDHFLMGSVAEGAIRTAVMPVLLIRATR